MLLPAEDRILQGLRDPDSDHPLGGNLDGFPSLRISTHTRLAVYQDHLANPWKGKPILGLFGRQQSSLIKQRPSGRFGNIPLICKPSYEL